MMYSVQTTRPTLAAIVLLSLFLAPGVQLAQTGKKPPARVYENKSIDQMYDRLATDLKAGKPLLVSGRAPVFMVGLAYRGVEIETAMIDYLHAVSRDDADTITTPDGTVIEYGVSSHVVGYVGHDYFMDATDQEKLLAESRGPGVLHKGVFGLACISDSYFRPSIQRPNSHILALNTSLTYPSAFTVAGIVRAVAAGHDHSGIHRSAARAFAKGQGQSVGTMRRTLAYGDKHIK